MVADVRHELRSPPAPAVYILLPLDSFGTLQVRLAGDVDVVSAGLPREVQATTPLVRVRSITSQGAVVGRTLLRERLLALLAGFFALAGLVLMAVGLYGTLSQAVTERTREIGIRVALGAHALGAVRSILAVPAASAIVGTVCGLAGGVYAAQFVETMLFDVTPRDAVSVVLPFSILLLTALVAAAIPAWRTLRVDPVVALRDH